MVIEETEFRVIGRHAECGYCWQGNVKPFWSFSAGGWLAAHPKFANACAYAQETPQGAVENLLKNNGYAPEYVAPEGKPRA